MTTSNDTLETLIARRLRPVPMRPGCEHGEDGTCEPNTELRVDERIRRLVAEYLRARKGK